MSEIARRSTTPAKAPKKTPAKKAPGAKAAPAKAAAKKTPAKAAAKKTPAKKAAKKAPAKKAAAKKVPPHKAGGPRPHKKAAKARGANSTNTSPGPSMGVPQLSAPPSDPMTLLGLDEPLRLTDLRRAWRAFATRHHPDRGGDAVTFAHGQHAYEVLQQRLGARD